MQPTRTAAWTAVTCGLITMQLVLLPSVGGHASARSDRPPVTPPPAPAPSPAGTCWETLAETGLVPEFGPVQTIRAGTVVQEIATGAPPADAWVRHGFPDAERVAWVRAGALEGHIGLAPGIFREFPCGSTPSVTRSPTNGRFAYGSRRATLTEPVCTASDEAAAALEVPPGARVEIAPAPGRTPSLNTDARPSELYVRGARAAWIPVDHLRPCDGTHRTGRARSSGVRLVGWDGSTTAIPAGPPVSVVGRVRTEDGRERLWLVFGIWDGLTSDGVIPCDPVRCAR